MQYWINYLLACVAVTAVCVVVILFAIYTAYIAYIHWKYSGIPSPKRSRFYAGHTFDTFGVMKELKEKEAPLLYFVNYWAQGVNSLTFVVFFFHTPFVVTLDPELTKEIVMNTKNTKAARFVMSFSTVFGKRFMGNGLLSVNDYDAWKPRRKLYDPAFNRNYLKSLLPVFNDITEDTVDKMRMFADGQTTISLKKYIAKFTMEVINKVAFGTDFSNLWTPEALNVKLPKDSDVNVFSHIVSMCFKGMNETFGSAYPPLNKYLHPIDGMVYRESVVALRKIGRDCIMRRIQMLQRGEDTPTDILTFMLSSNDENKDIEELVDDFCSFYTAGQETTANTLMFTLILLWQHPNCLERLRSEVSEVLEGRTSVTNDDLEKMTYTEQVISESLRLYPPVMGLFKCLAAETKFGNGYCIPAKTDIILMGSKMNRMPEYFDDPETFNPDRFNPENKKPSSFVYFPFGLGHRSCIGKHFAIMEMKVALARIVQTFTIKFPDGYKITIIQRGSVQPKDNLLCTLSLK